MSVTVGVLKNSDIDRASGTSLGLLWFLPAFGVVLPFVTAVAGSDHSSGTVWVWNVVGAICWICFIWAWFERRTARKLVRLLHARVGDLDADGIEYDGVRLFADTPLVQYQAQVSLIVFEFNLLTAPRVQRRGRAIVPSVVTLLLGWWGVPWGPVHTVRALWRNAAGGGVRAVRSLLVEALEPPAPKGIWWRRVLALDGGSRFQIALNVVVAAMFLFLGSLLLFALIRTAIFPAK